MSGKRPRIMVTESEFRALMAAAAYYESAAEDAAPDLPGSDPALYREWKKDDRLISRFAARWYDAADKR